MRRFSRFFIFSVIILQLQTAAAFAQDTTLHINTEQSYFVIDTAWTVNVYAGSLFRDPLMVSPGKKDRRNLKRYAHLRHTSGTTTTYLFGTKYH